MDTPDISISEEGGKRRNTSSLPLSGINHSGADRPTIDSNEAAVNGPVTADRFPALANRGM